MADNMTLYNAVRTPPPEALREIKAGRLSGRATSTRCGESRP